jgi:hypothetical protein
MINVKWKELIKEMLKITNNGDNFMIMILIFFLKLLFKLKATMLIIVLNNQGDCKLWKVD